MPKVELFPPFEKMLIARELHRFNHVMALKEGTVIKKNKHRSVVRLNFQWDGINADFYLKRHYWPEIKDKVKDLLCGRLPLSDAKQELYNIRNVEELGIPTMKPAAWGERNSGFLRRHSYLITESLGDLERLENFISRRFAKPLTPEEKKEKRRLIAAVAELVRRLHLSGFYHHDLYCGHILIREKKGLPPDLYLIDLQRMRPHRFWLRRWRSKDLSALDYTADRRAVSRADRLRFFWHYFGVSLTPPPRLTAPQKQWIRALLRRSARTARHTEKKRARYHALQEG